LLVPASAPELIDTWFRLAFGCQFMLAVRETEPVQPIDFGGLIRPSEPGDLSAIASFDKLLVDLQAGSPSFSGEDPSPLAHYERDWSDVWDVPAYTHVVAERDGRVLGHALLYLRPPGDLRVPTQGNIDLSHAATLPEVRGSWRRPRPYRVRPSMGLRTRVRLDDRGLALGEPALVPVLAKARVPRNAPPPLSSRPLTT
jgi:hypothetical protein